MSYTKDEQKIILEAANILTEDHEYDSRFYHGFEKKPTKKVEASNLQVGDLFYDHRGRIREVYSVELSPYGGWDVLVTTPGDIDSEFVVKTGAEDHDLFDVII